MQKIGLGNSIFLLLTVKAICVSIAEERRWQTRPVCACVLPRGADGLLRVEEGLGRRLLRGDVTVVHHVLEVTNLLVDVKTQPRGAGEVVDLALDAQVVLGAFRRGPDDLLVPVGIAVELAIVDAGHLLPQGENQHRGIIEEPEQYQDRSQQGLHTSG